jgi:ring-1,2-phenylacetyl-CoA epoxidase subunit PaaB
MALQNARDVYARRGTVLSIWVVRSSSIAATVPEDNASFFEGPNGKIYRHAHFYTLPAGMKDQ